MLRLIVIAGFLILASVGVSHGQNFFSGAASEAAQEQGDRMERQQQENRRMFYQQIKQYEQMCMAVSYEELVGFKRQLANGNNYFTELLPSDQQIRNIAQNLTRRASQGCGRNLNQAVEAKNQEQAPSNPIDESRWNGEVHIPTKNIKTPELDIDTAAKIGTKSCAYKNRSLKRFRISDEILMDKGISYFRLMVKCG